MPRKIISVTKQVMFDCAHYLVNDQKSREENIKMFHKCCLYKEDGTEEPHGHTYHLEVTVTGTIDEDNGFVIDFKKLKNILTEKIVDQLDHRLINNIEKIGSLATAENILCFIWDEIEEPINALRPRQAYLTRIRLWETPDSFATMSLPPCGNR